MMSAECDGVLERGDEDFAIRASSQMLAYLSANLGWQFVVDVRRQLPEKIQTMALTMGMGSRR
jgi:hypothetical protein